MLCALRPGLPPTYPRSERLPVVVVVVSRNPDVEIFGLALGAAVTGNAQGVLGRFLRIFYRHGAAGGLGLVADHDAVGGLDGGGQHVLAGLGDEPPLLEEGQDDHDRQRRGIH